MLYLSIPLPDSFLLCHPKRGWCAQNPCLKDLKGASQYYCLLSYNFAASCRVDFTTHPFSFTESCFSASLKLCEWNWIGWVGSSGPCCHTWIDSPWTTKPHSTCKGSSGWMGPRASYIPVSKTSSFRTSSCTSVQSQEALFLVKSSKGPAMMENN